VMKRQLGRLIGGRRQSSICTYVPYFQLRPSVKWVNYQAYGVQKCGLNHGHM